MTEEVREQDKSLQEIAKTDYEFGCPREYFNWDTAGVKDKAWYLRKAKEILTKVKQHYELEKAFAKEEGFDAGVEHERKYGQKRLDRSGLREKIRHYIVLYRAKEYNEDQVTDQILALIPDYEHLLKSMRRKMGKLEQSHNEMKHRQEHLVEEAEKQGRERILRILPQIATRFDHNRTCFDCVENIKLQALKEATDDKEA